MKIHIICISDGNGIRLITKFDKVDALQVASDWTNKGLNAQGTFKPGEIDRECSRVMDALLDRGEAFVANVGSVTYGTSDLDMSGVLEVLEDAKHTLNRNHALLQHMADITECNMTEGLDRASSRYFATEQALTLTAEKLRRKS